MTAEALAHLLYGIVVALLGLVWWNFDRRMTKIEAEVEKRAPLAAVQELTKDMRSTMDSGNVTQLSIAKIEFQMTRFVGHLVSEQKNRADVNSRFDKIELGLSADLREIRQKLDRMHGRRVSDGGLDC